MDCRVLGQLGVSGPAGTVHPAAARQRVVLAMLLLEANHMVPVERLIDAVWDEDPPTTARGQIQICVSALRRALAEAGIAEAIVTHPAGYLFQVDSGQLDLAEFDLLVGAGRAAAGDGRLREAAEKLGRALALWGAGPLPGMQNRLLQSVIAALEERRLAVTEEYLEVMLGLGLHHELIGELMTLTAKYPLREKFVYQLMTALHRDGRRAEALEIYRKARRAFVDQLGLEPSTALQDLERAVLIGEAVPVPAAVADQPPADSWWQPRMLPAAAVDFVGRDEEAGQLRELLLADGFGPNVVLVTGAGGAGKTALAVHVAHTLADSFPDGQLYVSFRGSEPRPPEASEVLERFLRVLGVAGSAIPPGLDERASFYRSLLAGRRILVVLDDVASEEQVLPLLPGHSEAAVIVTSRVWLPGVTGGTVEVGSLPTVDGLAFLEHVVGQERVYADPAASETLLRLCDQLPLALRIAAARLAARPHWSVQQLVSRLADEQHRLDELTHHNVGVRANIAGAYDRLEDDAKRLFRCLAVMHTPDFGRWLPAPLLDMPQDHAEDLLDQLVDARLLEAERLDSGMVRYQFHNLIRVYAREQLAAHEPEADRREALHRVLRAWLYLADQAHVREYGGEYTIVHSAAQGWPLPRKIVDTELADSFAWYEAERVALVDAVRQAANAGFHDICWDLAMSAVTLFEARSYLDDWRETHEVALATCRRHRNRLGEAAMLYSLGSLALSEGNFVQARERLDRAQAMFAELGNQHGVGLTDRNLARIDRTQGDIALADARYERALLALRAAGDVIGQAHVLSNIAQIRIDQGRHDVAEKLLTESIEIAREAGCRRVEAQARSRLGQSLLDRDDLPAASRAFHEVIAVTRDMGDLVGEAYALQGLGTTQLRLGDYAQAGLLLGQAQRIAADNRERPLLAQVQLTRGELFLATGRSTDAARLLAEARDGFERLHAGPSSAIASELLSRCDQSQPG